MIVERYPNLKEEVGGSIFPSYEISSLLDKKTCQVVNYLMCFGAGLSSFYLQINKYINVITILHSMMATIREGHGRVEAAKGLGRGGASGQ